MVYISKWVYSAVLGRQTQSYCRRYTVNQMNISKENQIFAPPF